MRRKWLNWRRIVLVLLFLSVVLPFVLTLVFRFLPPPLTPLMVLRQLQGRGLQKEWRGLEATSPHLRRAVIASEDGKFCSHHGFDWDAIDNAVDRSATGGRVLGARTISM